MTDEQKCVWIENEMGKYETECGKSIELAPIQALLFNFCPFCGKEPLRK